MVSANNLTRGKFYPESDGLVVGSNSEDGYAMVATVSDGTTRAVAVVVGAKDENFRAAEIKRLLEFGLVGFEYRQIEVAGTFVRKINIKDGENKKIKTEAASDFSVLLNKNDFEKVERKIEITKTIKAPAKKGDVVGEVVYMLEEKELGRANIVLSEDMEKAGWFTLLIRKILAFFGLE
jgi:D-alanyl-D-alanine carboxypeptidase (penicillin-binding protein 5/6)